MSLFVADNPSRNAEYLWRGDHVKRERYAERFYC